MRFIRSGNMTAAALALNLFCLTGCESAPEYKTYNAPKNQKEARATELIINAPKKVLWPLVAEEVTFVYPLQAIDEAAGVMGTSVVSIYLGHGNIFLKNYVFIPENSAVTDWKALRMKMNVLVKEVDPGRTLVKIMCRYEIQGKGDKEAKGPEWQPVESNGSAESDILTRIKRRLEQQGK